MTIQPAVFVIPVTVDASGNFSSTLKPPHGCNLLQYRYVPDVSTPLDTNADITLVGAKTAFSYVAQNNIGTAAFQKLPRHPVSDTAGAAGLYAAGGAAVLDKMAVAGEDLTFTVAQGGNALKGTFYFWFGD